MEGYQSSLDEINDNFNFNNDYDDDCLKLLQNVQSLIFLFNFAFQMFEKLEYTFRQDEYL